MANNYDVKNLVKGYSTFDAYLASGQFATLSPTQMVDVYQHFEKLGKLEAGVQRRELVLDPRRSVDGEPIEDLSIIQPDGSRACANWELDARGFQLVSN
ncbi:MAG: hypothetical protein WCI72_02220 [archaeon]